ncbi:D-alanyl-D-alanine carboxypeptidase family protein [Anaerocolumna xylanovorans]|uniref:serine-type D-Ala-D-Ala carboxypeptidase n=1 Tax=Anaerocolumna xylanovorans DSM 12503 TaxID=1121345 RepID=A0A1M7Y1W2_9FIRM|nr:D-alanyl-D-alanine carboxypeptidase family protein [Anaerocolumna xylanovorans]SHO45805.1 D-alanyl-D-alanine carboxypeptidase (penicillin-binding protein 5/6) [Anaerocolumna xylanovorans DSM 12503]
MKNRIISIILIIIVLAVFSTVQYNAVLKQLTYDRLVTKELLKEKNPDIKKRNVKEEKQEKEPSGNVETKETKTKSDTDAEDGIKKSSLTAKAAALVDASNGRVLYEKNGYEELPMASTTKIMTCIVALENANLDDVVTVSKYASSMPDVQLNMIAGEKFYLRDLLYSLMLESHNDTAVAIAEHVGGSVTCFAMMMNAKAKELGCEHTSFVTPNGLDADGHYTTAVELSRIASYAIKNKEFLNIINTPSWQFTDITKGRTFAVNNKDRFLSIYDGAIGIKTGFTGKAGYCFVGAVQKDGKTFISTVLGSGWPPHKNYKWADTKSLMDYGMKNYEMKQVFYTDKKFDPVAVVKGKENYAYLYYEGDISLLIRKGEEVRVDYSLPSILKAPVVSDTQVGTAKYYIGDAIIGVVPILTKNSVEKIDFTYCFQKLYRIWRHMK